MQRSSKRTKRRIAMNNRTKPDSVIKILIVDDHPLFRLGLRTAIEQTDDMIVVGEVETGEAAVTEARELGPDVVLMDLALPDISGIVATGKISAFNENIKVIMLTGSLSDEHVTEAIAAGATGYCLKSADAERLRLAVRSVTSGALWFDSIAAEKIGAKVPAAPESKKQDAAQPPPTMPLPMLSEDRFADLSQRELEVLELIIKGQSNRSIASSLNISMSTTKTHISNILKRLNVSDRTQAAVKALSMMTVMHRA